MGGTGNLGTFEGAPGRRVRRRFPLEDSYRYRRVRPGKNPHPRTLGITLPRFLGIDAGRKRVGLALSDPTLTYALPLESVSAKESVNRIAQLLQEEAITHIVIGLPTSLDGSSGPQRKRTEKFLRLLERCFPEIPVIAFDERMTSRAADALSPYSRSTNRDAGAAAVILTDYLRSRKHSSSPAPSHHG
ncbi:MAG: Holliday junction resolvase RuvX [Candidatus Hydrogenedentota bacterium]|nr:MAG: Holliday junction resolvase RuvX [Candidatus Hydrogenedentota bacterium]